MQQLNNANQQNDTLQQKNDELTAQKEEVQKKLDELTTGNTSVLAQYQSLIWVLQYYRTGDLVTAAKTFADAGFDMIEDENIQTIISSIRQDMAGNIYQSLVQQGLQLWNGGDKTQAMDYFQASLKIQPDNPEAMFYVGRLYQESGDTENANACLTRSLENMETLNMPRRHQRQEDIKCEDTRVKRSEIPCKLACRRIFELGTRQKHE